MYHPALHTVKLFVWIPLTERRKCFDVTHYGLFLFECHPQKVTLFECYPQNVAFVSRLPTKKLKSYRVTHRQMLLFQCYPQKGVLFSRYPQKAILCWVYPQRGFLWKGTNRRAEKAWGYPYLTTSLLSLLDGEDPTLLLLCFIDLRVRKIRNEASSCLGIFSSTLRFYYVASSPGSPLPHLLDVHRHIVGSSAILASACPGQFGILGKVL